MCRRPGSAQGRIDERGRHSAEIRSVAAVAVVFRARRETGLHGILVDVSNEGEEVLVRLAQDRLVSALEDMAYETYRLLKPWV